MSSCRPTLVMLAMSLALVGLDPAANALAGDRDCWQWGDYLHLSDQADANAYLIAMRADRIYGIENNLLQIYDNSAQNFMRLLISYPLFNAGENAVYSLAIAGDRLLVGTRTDIRVYDISGPTPTFLGSGTWENASYFNAISVADNRIYAICDPINANPYLLIFDLPVHPVSLPHVGLLQVIGATDLVVSGHYAYIAAGNALKVIDIESGENPRLVRTVAASATTIAIAGHYAYTAYQSLAIIDIADPEQATVVGTVPLSTDSNFAVDLVANGTDVLIAFGYPPYFGYLLIVDAIDPAYPVLSGLVDVSHTPTCLVLASDSGQDGYHMSRAFAASAAEAYVVDWAIPASPPYTCYQAQISARTVKIEDGTAFVLDNYSATKSFESIDLATGDSRDRFELGSVSVSDLAIDGGRGFVVLNRGAEGANVLVVDVSEPTDLRYLNATVVSGANDVAAAGSRVGVVSATQVSLYDLTSDARLVLLATGSFGGDRIILAGEYLVTATTQMLRVFSRAGSSLLLSGELSLPFRITDICADAGRLYCSDINAGLIVVEISEDGELVELGRADINRNFIYYPDGIAIADGIAYVAYCGLGVAAFDVSDPENPHYIGSTPNCGDIQSAFRVAVQGEYLCLANGAAGIQVLTRQCNVPVVLSAFAAESIAGEAHLTWQTPEARAGSEFRMVGNRDGETDWEVPISTTSYGRYHEAWDRSVGLCHGGVVVYRLYLRSESDSWMLLGETSTDVPSSAGAIVLTAFPNPFNPRTTLQFSVPSAGLVRLSIYDLTGHKVADLVNEWLPAGRYERLWSSCAGNGRELASGKYLAKLQTEVGFRMQPLSLIR